MANNIILEKNCETNLDKNTDLYEQSSIVDVNIKNTDFFALTIRKDYNLTIAKNAFTITGRMSLKTLFITTIINILNMIF